MINLALGAIPKWESDNASELKQMLSTPCFQLALACVLEQAPSLLDGADVNKTLVASGEVKGFELALQSLFRLTHEQPEAVKASPNYPSLDDDSAWQDKNQP